VVQLLKAAGPFSILFIVINHLGYLCLAVVEVIYVPSTIISNAMRKDRVGSSRNIRKETAAPRKGEIA
jgi:hypothetical protein